MLEMLRPVVEGYTPTLQRRLSAVVNHANPEAAELAPTSLSTGEAE
jgi:hypothetical protein